jgi:hypothetical protein
LLLGAAAGLKWTFFVYAVAMTATLLLLWRILRLDWRRFGAFAAGGVLGFLPAGGYWSWLLWTRYGNPVLPYWNDYFQSPWMPTSDFRDMRFPPHSVWEGLSYAFQFFIGGNLHPSSEGPLRDARFAILTLLVPIVLAVAAIRFTRRVPNAGAMSAAPGMAQRQSLWLVLTFFTLSYAIWLGLFAIHRYLSPLTFLTGLLILLCVDYLLASRPVRVAAFLFLASFSVYWMQVDLSGWRVPYREAWFGLQLPAETQTPNTLFVLLGGGPVSHIVPYLPESSVAVRLFPVTMPPDGETPLTRRAAEIITQHAGPMRSLSLEPLQPVDFDYLQQFRLVLDEPNCIEFPSDVDRFRTCELHRQAASNPKDQGLQR